MFLRLITGFFLLILFSSGLANENELLKADSLFALQKYTEAYAIYESVYNQGQASPSMLLRMAFIKDGLGNYVDALYFLDLYYTASADKSVVTKIEEISEEQNLEGYSYNDMHFFRSLLNRFKGEIQLLLVAVAGLLVAYIFRRKQQDEKPVTASIIQIVVVVLLLLVTNGFFEEKLGIINQNNTLLRSGPSAGAEPVEIISKGHKVKVLERSDVWTKILWEGDEVFIRNAKIRII